MVKCGVRNSIIIITVAANDWVIKYFIDASNELVDLFIFIIGLIEIKLITRPNHIVSQEEDEIAINVPIAVVDIKIRMKVGVGRMLVLKFKIIYLISGTSIKQIAIIRGRIIAHAVHIRLSYRTRGRVARKAINSVLIIATVKILRVKLIKVWVPGIMNKITDIVDITIMVRYSAMKIIANLAALYSVLNPDTSSDSPSAVSKGVRLVSAKHVIIHANKMGDKKSKRGNPFSRIIGKLKVFIGRRILTKINAILIS